MCNSLLLSLRVHVYTEKHPYFSVQVGRILKFMLSCFRFINKVSVITLSLPMASTPCLLFLVSESGNLFLLALKYQLHTSVACQSIFWHTHLKGCMLYTCFAKISRCFIAERIFKLSDLLFFRNGSSQENIFFSLLSSMYLVYFETGKHKNVEHITFCRCRDAFGVYKGVVFLPISLDPLWHKFL